MSDEAWDKAVANVQHCREKLVKDKHYRIVVERDKKHVRALQLRDVLPFAVCMCIERVHVEHGEKQPRPRRAHGRLPPLAARRCSPLLAAAATARRSARPSQIPHSNLRIRTSTSFAFAPPRKSSAPAKFTSLTLLSVCIISPPI